MTPDERHEAIMEAKSFVLAAPVILPLLEKRKRNAIDRMQVGFKAGSTDFMTLVAEITILSDLEREIKQKEQIYNTLAEKQK